MKVHSVPNHTIECPSRLSDANRITWDLSDPLGEDRKFRESLFDKLPRLFQVKAARSYRKLYLSRGRANANSYLRGLAEDLDYHTTELATNEDAIKQYAERRSIECANMISGSTTETEAYTRISEYVENLGFQAPKVKKNITLSGALARLRDPGWWRQQIRHIYPMKFESAAIRCGMVHSKTSLYVSNESLFAFRARLTRIQNVLAGLEMTNEVGQSYNLKELADLSVSNPANRRNELMTRLSGFDKIAIECDHAGLFITITCPSRMHARYGKTGHVNPRYDRTTPHEAHKYLCKLWARIRAKLKNTGIHVYGFRISEPQHDGTPHWHILLYTMHQNIEATKTICMHYTLQDSPDEKGAKERRCIIKMIDWSKGSGIGYIAKYISKNIDGAYLDTDLYGHDAKNSAFRVLAWRSIHTIRQFQQFGGPSVTCWREFRKLHCAPDGILEEARTAADNGDWEQFTKLMGGTQILKKDQPIKVHREFSDECGKYGEAKGFQIEGISDGDLMVSTRLHQWTLQKAHKEGRGAESPRHADAL